MADQESFFWGVDLAEEEVTALDLNIIVISDSEWDEADEADQEEPLLPVKHESEEEDWRILALPASSVSTAQGEGSCLSDEDQPTTSAGVVAEVEWEIEDLLDRDYSQEEEEEELEEEEEEEEEEECGEEPQLPTLVATARSWQRRPDSPPIRPRERSRVSPAWEFFSVPVATTKAEAFRVKCVFCTKEYSRGQEARSNQSRGTATMLRHLYAKHWNNMTPAFRQKYAESRRRALRLAVGQDVQEVDLAVGNLDLADSASAAPPASQPSGSDPQSVEGDRFTVTCRFCMYPVCGLRVDYDDWKAMLLAHCSVCPRH